MISFNFPLTQGRVHAGQTRFAGNGENGKSHQPTAKDTSALKSAPHADQWSKWQDVSSETRKEKGNADHQPEQREVDGKTSPLQRAMGKMGMLSLQERRDMHQADTARNRTMGFDFESSDEFDSGDSDSDEQEGYVTLPKPRRTPTYTYTDYRRNEQNEAWRAVLAFQESRRAELESRAETSKGVPQPKSK